MNNDEKYVNGYSYYTDESRGTTVVRLKFTDGTWDHGPFGVFTKDERFDFKHLPIIGLTKSAARERISQLRRASVGGIYHVI